MYRLYNEYGAANFPGGTLSDRVANLIQEFLVEHPDADLNDVENIVGQTAGAVLAEKRLRYANKTRLAERALKAKNSGA
jgi:hypothetical protein